MRKDRTSDDYYQTSEGKWRKKEELMNEGSSQDITPEPSGSRAIINSKLMMTSTQIDHMAIAKALMDECHFATMKDTGQIYIYKDGVFVPDGRTEIESMAREMLGDQFSTHRVNEISNSIKMGTYADRDSFDRNSHVLNLSNGLLNMKVMKCIDHTPDYLSIVRIPVLYNEDAVCPTIDGFLREVLNGDDIPVIEEMLGYSLLNNYKFHKAFMLQGAGRNGKSTLLNLLQAFLGMDNCSNVALTSLCNDRFAKAQLFGKLANIYSDLPSEALKNSADFKALSGGDRITAEHKFQAAFAFTNYAKLIFSCNYVPMTHDLSNAFFDRWIIIRFPNMFTGEKMNPNLLAKLTTEDELSGLLNLAIRGLKRLLENGGFTYRKSLEEVQDEYERLSNPVAAFLADMCEEDPEEYAIKDELYNVFKSYCKSNGYSIFSEKMFTGLLKKLAPVNDYRPTVNGERKRAWQGIKLAS